MSDVRQNFYSRIGRMDERRPHGVKNPAYYVTHDGHVVVQQDRPVRRRALRTLLYCVVALLAFKTLVLAFSGTVAYQERIDGLRDGAMVEQAGAFLMQIDPISSFLADKLAPYVR